MRSKLFVPANRPELFEKALLAGADAVCFDLEDAVPAERKAEARVALQAFLEGRTPGTPLLIVRTNAVTSSDFRLDLAVTVWSSVHAIAVPKVESSEEMETAVEAITALELERGITAPLGILPTIESPRGLRLASEICRASGRIIGLQLGFADLLEPLGIPADNRFARDQVRLMARLAAAEADLDCYDSDFPDFRDAASFAQHLNAGRSFGFAGASCIHPQQITAANQAYTPSPEALLHAEQLVAAAREASLAGRAVTSLNGKMIDRPFVLAAERLLARGRRYAQRGESSTGLDA